MKILLYIGVACFSCGFPHMFPRSIQSKQLLRFVRFERGGTFVYGSDAKQAPFLPQYSRENPKPI
jgi:hypothetical protein